MPLLEYLLPSVRKCHVQDQECLKKNNLHTFTLVFWQSDLGTKISKLTCFREIILLSRFLVLRELLWDTNPCTKAFLPLHAFILFYALHTTKQRTLFFHKGYFRFPLRILSFFFWHHLWLLIYAIRKSLWNKSDIKRKPFILLLYDNKTCWCCTVTDPNYWI